MKNPVVIAQISNLENKQPIHALVNGLDLVVVKFDEDISVLYGRCLHRGALMADGHIDGHNLICGVHGCLCDAGGGYCDNDVLVFFINQIGLPICGEPRPGELQH